MKSKAEILINRYGCEDIHDLKSCFIDKGLSLSMILEAMQEFADQQNEILLFMVENGLGEKDMENDCT